ncbi:transcriptional regulator protein [Ketogulonicigenium robustum]|uniref:Transcriptional regulator protein n=1 Tax=Ketogulonicigenium robustum TaxID=92947 RepID=A0A1W6NZ72_9RHOB|nr:LysR family transcriptional regulator [Ketogulonicigenium robustum]ARO14489.1 transcriptional regulator protein [Ketogulonicigenium robustum]
MDIDAIELFNELARSGSIRQTAEVMGMSPTAVVRQIDKIEHEFGATLLDRTPRGVRLTAAGEVLVAGSREIARELRAMQQRMDDLKGLRRGHVSIHVNGAAISSILAPVLYDFSHKHPRISIEVSVSSAQGALDAVAGGLTDMAVTMFAPVDTRIVNRFKIPVRHEPIMAADHPLAAQKTITVDDLVRHRLALPDRSYGVRRAFDARLRAHGFDASEAGFTTSSLELQKELAMRGVAVLILPEMAVQRELDAGYLVARPFIQKDRIETLLELSHSVSRHQSMAARRLLEFIESFLRRHHG